MYTAQCIVCVQGAGVVDPDTTDACQHCPSTFYFSPPCHAASGNPIMTLTRPHTHLYITQRMMRITMEVMECELMEHEDNMGKERDAWVCEVCAAQGHGALRSVGFICGGHPNHHTTPYHTTPHHTITGQHAVHMLPPLWEWPRDGPAPVGVPSAVL